MVMPLIDDAINRHRPYGGVTRPRARVTTMIRPRIMGLIPKLTAAGRIIGTNKIIAGTASIKVPTNIKNATTTSKNTSFPPDILEKKDCTATFS